MSLYTTSICHDAQLLLAPQLNAAPNYPLFFHKEDSRLLQQLWSWPVCISQCLSQLGFPAPLTETGFMIGWIALANVGHPHVYYISVTDSSHFWNHVAKLSVTRCCAVKPVTTYACCLPFKSVVSSFYCHEAVTHGWNVHNRWPSLFVFQFDSHCVPMQFLKRQR